MLGVAPADEERDQAAGHRVECQAPPEHCSGWPGPLRVDHVAWVVAVAPGRGDGRVAVVAGKRPAHPPAGAAARCAPAQGRPPPTHPAVAYTVDPEGTRHGWLRLFGVGSDDL